MSRSNLRSKPHRAKAPPASPSGFLAPIPSDPDEYCRFEAAVLRAVSGRRLGNDQSPAQRRVQLQIWADHDAHRRQTNTMLMFWKACADGACRRAKSCNGDPHACFSRCRPHVPQEFKVLLRAAIRALGEGASKDEALQIARDALIRAEELAARDAQDETEAKDARAAAAVSPANAVMRRESPAPRARLL